MNRLTARNPQKIAYLVNVKPNEQEVDSKYPNTLNCIMDCFERLAEYEDTGLSTIDAKEIKRILDEYGTVFTVTEHMIDISDLQNINDQERYAHNGWVVVEIPASIGFLKSLKKIGETVFFSREEAEAQAQKFTNEKLRHEDIHLNML